VGWLSCANAHWMVMKKVHNHSSRNRRPVIFCKLFFAIKDMSIILNIDTHLRSPAPRPNRQTVNADLRRYIVVNPTIQVKPTKLLMHATKIKRYKKYLQIF